MLASMLGPDEGHMDNDFDDYDFGDQELPVVGDILNNQENTTEADDNNDFMDEGAVIYFSDYLFYFNYSLNPIFIL